MAETGTLLTDKSSIFFIGGLQKFIERIYRYTVYLCRSLYGNVTVSFFILIFRYEEPSVCSLPPYRFHRFHPLLHPLQFPYNPQIRTGIGLIKTIFTKICTVIFIIIRVIQSGCRRLQGTDITASYIDLLSGTIRQNPSGCGIFRFSRVNGFSPPVRVIRSMLPPVIVG